MFARTERVELAELWEELTTGGCKVEGWSYGRDDWSLSVTRGAGQAGAHRSALRPRDLEILEQALLCGVRKVVAVEAGLSCSSVALILQSGFQFMGLDCLPSRIPGLLVAAAHARHHPDTQQLWRLQACRHPKLARQTLSVPRPDRALVGWLAPAEHAVIRLLIEGLSYLEIAQVRATSVRTVANQVAAGFRRLGVSGRADLLCLLSRWSLEANEPPLERRAALPSISARSKLVRGARAERGGVGPHCLSPGPAT